MVRHSWRRSWRLHREHTRPNRVPGRDRVFTWGDGVIARRTAAAYLARFIDATATTTTCLVAAVDTDHGTSEPLAWVCRELLERDDDGDRVCALHYAYTLHDAQRKGLALSLVRYVLREAETLGVDVEATHINGKGRALLEKAAEQ